MGRLHLISRSVREGTGRRESWRGPKFTVQASADHGNGKSDLLPGRPYLIAGRVSVRTPTVRQMSGADEGPAALAPPGTGAGRLP